VQNSSPARPPRAALVLGKVLPGSAHSRRPPSCMALPPARGESQLEPARAPLNVIVVVVLAATLFRRSRSSSRALSRRVNASSWASGQVLTCRCLCKQRDRSHRHHARLAEDRRTFNPLSYVVDALRTFMLSGTTSTFGLGRDYAVIAPDNDNSRRYRRADYIPSCIVHKTSNLKYLISGRHPAGVAQTEKRTDGAIAMTTNPRGRKTRRAGKCLSMCPCWLRRTSPGFPIRRCPPRGWCSAPPGIGGTAFNARSMRDTYLR